MAQEDWSAVVVRSSNWKVALRPTSWFQMKPENLLWKRGGNIRPPRRLQHTACITSCGDETNLFMERGSLFDQCQSERIQTEGSRLAASIASTPGAFPRCKQLFVGPPQFNHSLGDTDQSGICGSSCRHNQQGRQPSERPQWRYRLGCRTTALRRPSTR